MHGGAQDSATGEVCSSGEAGSKGEGGRSAGGGRACAVPGAASTALPGGKQLTEVAKVSFLTAALMGVALCFHSVLEVCARAFKGVA